jgi:DNA invertase Pin-like site-specific DNA recombinase
MTSQKIVAGYCRVSTLEQKKGYGIDIQMREITRYTEGMRVEWYIDEARSGVTEDRRALKRLLRDCRAGKLSGIAISSLDRLSRSLRLTENLLFEFEQLDIPVLIADMPHYDGGNRRDVLVRQIREAIAEENRKEIIDRLKKGREERTLKGGMAGGMLPYGYSRNGREVTKDRHETEMVKAIYTLNDSGENCREIADELNGQGFVRRNGKPWTQRQVHSVLARERLYRSGVVRYGRTEGENHDLAIL